MAAWAKNNGSFQTAFTGTGVKVYYGDFYYPRFQASKSSYQYIVSDTGFTSAQSASTQGPNRTVWAKEWSAKYITQLYTTSELRDVYSGFSQSNQWHSYQPVGGTSTDDSDNSDPENFHAKFGTNNSGTSAIGSNMIVPSQLMSSSNSNRRWVAQFSSTGLKVPKTAEPSTVTGETIGDR